MDRAALMRTLEPDVEAFTANHLAARGGRLWMPDELLFPASSGHRDERTELLRREARAIPNALRAVLVLNGLTESGLPHFHRLLATHLGEDSHWRRWTDLWTAEEDRHDGLLHDLLRYTDAIDIAAVERLQYEYLLSGFRPDWQKDPYKLVAYTTLQERATQISHGNLGKFIKSKSPECAILLGRIAGEEMRHALFYARVMAKILEHDPDGGLIALWDIASNFKMPGSSMQGYDDLAYVAQWSGVFGAAEYASLLSEVSEKLGLPGLQPTSEVGLGAQADLLAMPARLRRMDGLMRTRKKLRCIRVPFLEDDIVL